MVEPALEVVVGLTSPGLSSTSLPEASDKLDDPLPLLRVFILPLPLPLTFVFTLVFTFFPGARSPSTTSTEGRTK